MHCNNLRLVLGLGLVRVNSSLNMSCTFHYVAIVKAIQADCLARSTVGLGLRLGLVFWSGLALEQTGW